MIAGPGEGYRRHLTEWEGSGGDDDRNGADDDVAVGGESFLMVRPTRSLIARVSGRCRKKYSLRCIGLHAFL